MKERREFRGFLEVGPEEKTSSKDPEKTESRRTGNHMNERREFKRVFSLIPEEDVVLFSVNSKLHFKGRLLDLSRGGALVYSSAENISVDVGYPYKLYLQSGGDMFCLEATLIRTNLQFFAFRFVNITPGDVSELRAKLARMEMIAARVGK